MLFNVKIVTEADYTAYLDTLKQQGNVSDQPLLGGITVRRRRAREPVLEGGSQ